MKLQNSCSLFYSSRSSGKGGGGLGYPGTPTSYVLKMSHEKSRNAKSGPFKHFCAISSQKCFKEQRNANAQNMSERSLKNLHIVKWTGSAHVHGNVDETRQLWLVLKLSSVSATVMSSLGYDLAVLF